MIYAIGPAKIGETLRGPAVSWKIKTIPDLSYLNLMQ